LSLSCLAAAAVAAAAFKLLFILLLSGRPLRQARAAATTKNDGGPAPARSPGATGRHQHERDRHGDCQAGTEWRDRPGRYKPDSDCQCRVRLGVTRGRAARPTGTGRPGAAGCWARALCLVMIIQVQNNISIITSNKSAHLTSLHYIRVHKK